jgi:ATPase subunit of ABC transporter with duplicated ATPase domains
MLLSLAHVSFAYADAVPILTDVTYAFGPGWHGLVGPNGSGKTTLLGLLAGTLPPDRGAARRLPHDLGVRSCPQGVEDLLPDVQAFAEAHDGLASKLRGRLALDPRTLERWS